MVIKKCCIDNCKSCSIRKADKGVTYHKFPKDHILYDKWMSVTQNKCKDTALPMYVCSRHFCKNDFQTYKDNKYILKSDAVPSIFPWTTINIKEKMDKLNFIENNDDPDVSTSKEAEENDVENEPQAALTNTTNEFEIESVAAIRKFIEAQEREIQELKSSTKTSTEKANDDSMDSKFSQSETISVASSVLDMIITESELELAKKKDDKNKIMSPDRSNNSVALSVGSKIEVKDFVDYWHPARIKEVDFDEMEVLIHYDIETKHDEWISVNSPRLRPEGSMTVKPGPSSIETLSSDRSASPSSVKEEPKDGNKVDDKVKPTFVVGERCLARWRDNRRFVATVNKVFENGSYEIIFDDGCLWTCTTSRLYKMRPGKEQVSKGAPNSSTIASPQSGMAAGLNNVTPQTNTYAVYHTHLFDPTRDYLPSKSERREMKRKLNIKEIFNIGQKKSKTQKPQDSSQKTPAERKPRIIKRKHFKLKPKLEVKTEIKIEDFAVDAVASIIGSLSQENTSVIKQETVTDVKEEITPEIEQEHIPESNPVTSNKPEVKANEKSVNVVVELKDDKVVNENNLEKSSDNVSAVDSIGECDKIELEDLKPYLDPEVLEEEVKLEQFEKPDEGTHEEVIDRIKEVINKLEDGLKEDSASVGSPKPQIKIEIPQTETHETKIETVTPKVEEKPENAIEVKTEKKLSKIKKGKKLRLLREKKVKKQVEKVKSELEEMRKQVEEMRKQMLRSQELSKGTEMPESFLLPGEWCCKWVNGQPVGTVSEMEYEMKYDPNGKPPLPRRSVQVEDKRLPEGWTKHMVRRSLGHSAGKWDIVLISPDNRRFHTKNEMRIYLENNPDKNLSSFEHALTDFGVHLKLARNMGWITNTPDGIANGPDNRLQAGAISSTSPLIKRKSLSLKRKGIKKVPKLTIKMKRPSVTYDEFGVAPTSAGNFEGLVSAVNTEQNNTPILEDGHMYVGSLKVQVIDNLLRCPAEGCLKNFRNNTLLKMHIKHYHRELRKMMGTTPKVLDLASKRTMPPGEFGKRPRKDGKIIKVKLPRLPKRKHEEMREIKDNPDLPRPTTPKMDSDIAIPRSQDSPKLRQALINKPIKRPRVLLPVRKAEPDQAILDSMNEELIFENNEPINRCPEIFSMDNLDFETAISTHTVTKPVKGRSEKNKKPFVIPPKVLSEEEDWFAMNSDVETRSSFPRSGSPDSKLDSKATLASSESNEDIKETSNTYMYNESGERIKIVHMKREEIINCHCGYREEDGLMVQCELCLCWQHALCHNIQRETDVPDKYTCSICLNPRRGRRSMRFVHDQDRLYEGLLPGARPDEALRRSHELSGNLLRIEDALHALRLKYYVATKKDHPKLYLWAKDWEHVEIQNTQEKLNSDYSDLSIIINNVGKENLPIKPEDVKDMPPEFRTSPLEDSEHDRFSQRDLPLGSQSLLSGLLSSPGGTSLDLPISTSELERLAKSVQEQDHQGPLVSAPEPEAAIENSACRERLLKHLHRCQALIDARLDSIEAQIAELESQDPSFEDDETAEFFPRTKQTIQMLMRDLDTMEELGVIT